MDILSFKLTQFMTNSFFQGLFLNEFNKHMKIYNNKNTDICPWGDLNYMKLTSSVNFEKFIISLYYPRGLSGVD